MRRIIILMALMSSPVWAGDGWTSQASESQLQFIISFEGQEVIGAFHDFKVNLAFDPEGLHAASLEVLVDINSADMDSDDLNSEILKPDWFAAGQFPQARFFSDSIRSNGASSFVASGSLRLKGIEKTIEVPFTWSVDNERAQLRGELELQRTDFAIGSGDWANGDTISAVVKVRYAVSLDHPADKVNE